MGVRTTLRLPRTVHTERLAEVLTDTPLVLIEGGPGYGKSVLARQVAEHWAHDSHWLPLDAPLVDTVARLRAFRRPLLLIADAVDCSIRAHKVLRLAGALPTQHRLLVTWQGNGRRLRPQERNAPTLGVGPHELLFSPAEIEVLLWQHLGADAARLTTRVHQSSAGWPDGVAALLSGLSRGDARVLAARLDADAGPAGLVAQRAARLSDAHRHALAQARSLPHLREPLLHVLGRDLLRSALAVGLPFSRDEHGDWVLPPALARMLPVEPLDAELAARCATVCEKHGWHEDAALLRWRSGQFHESLATGDDAVSTRLRQHVSATAASNPQLLADHLRAEQARELLRRGYTARARRLAAELLATHADGPVRAIALEVLGRVARRRAATDDLLLAQRLLRESLALWRRSGEPARMAGLRLSLAWVDRDLADPYQAAARAAAVRADSRAGSGIWAQAALMEADALCDLGSAGEAEALLVSVADFAAQCGATDVGARAALLRARAATLRGDRLAAVTHLAHATDPAAWMDGVCSARALGEAAELWSRAGDAVRAQGCLRLLATLEHEPTVDSMVARAAVDARIGDPLQASAALSRVVAQGAVAPRERWRVHLLTALAHARAGQIDSARSNLRDALAAAAACAQPHAPFLREREAVQDVLQTTQAVP